MLTGGHSSTNFVKTCVPRLQRVVEKPKYSGYPVASKVALVVKNHLSMQETPRDMSSIPGVRKIPWRRAWQPIPVFFPGESPMAEEPGGLQSMGRQRVGLSTLKARYVWEEF